MIRSAKVVIRGDRVRVASSVRARQVTLPWPRQGDLPLPPYFTRKIKALLAFAADPTLAAAVGLDGADLDGPAARIPLPVYHALLERAAVVTGDPHLGLRFALHWHELQRHGRGAVGVMMRSCPTLRALCDRLVRFERFWRAGDAFDVAERGTEFHLRYRVWGPWREAHRHTAEMTVAGFLGFVSDLHPPTLAVRFSHGPSGDPSEVARLLGLQPTYGAPSTEIVLARAAMDLPLAGADVILFRLSERYLTLRLGELPSDVSTFAAHVRQAVQGVLHEDGFGQAMVARLLACGSRTLERRLAAEGTTLRAIVDDVRKSRARELLESRMRVAEVGFLLGYSEPAAFEHAFRRWYGMCPTAWRKGGKSAH